MRKEYLIPLVIIPLIISFCFVCLFILFKKDNPKLIRFKSRLISIMLFFLGFLSYGFSQGNSDESEPLQPEYGVRSRFIFIGPTAGVNFSTIPNIVTANLPFQTPGKYTGTGYYVGVFADFPIENNHYEHFIYLNLNYEKIAPERNITINNLDFINSLVDGNSTELNLNQKVNLSYFNLNMGYENNYFRRFLNFYGGIEAGYLLSGEHIETFEIPAASNSSFKKDVSMHTSFKMINDKKIEFRKHDIDFMKRIKIAFPVSLSSSIILGKWYLTLTGSYNFSLTYISDDENSKISQFRLGLSILLPFY